MRKIALVCAALTLIAFSATADDGYKFHITVTDGRTGLKANPQFADLKMSEEQLERASHDRVMVLDQTSGAHWTWLMLSWLEEKPTAEQGINTHGGASVDKDADLGLSATTNGSVTTRCLRERCRFHVITRDKKETSVLLTKDQSLPVPFDSDVAVMFEP